MVTTLIHRRATEHLGVRPLDVPVGAPRGDGVVSELDLIAAAVR